MRSQRGFTLIEVMVATMVMGLAIVAAMQLFGSSLRLAGASARQTQALVIARSLVDQELWRLDLEEGNQSGQEGEYFWTVGVRPIERNLVGLEEEPGLGLNSESDFELFEIYCEVTWEGFAHGRVELVSARLAEAL